MVHYKKKEAKVSKQFILLFFSITLILLISSFSLVASTKGSFFVQPTKGSFFVQPANFCLDGIIADKEECDTLDLANQTCITRGYDSGTLTCNNECMFDESGCKIKQSSSDILPTNGDGGSETQEASVIPSTGQTDGGGGGNVSSKSGEGYYIMEECNDKIDNDADGKCDYNGCVIDNINLSADPGCTNIYDNSEIDASCLSSWQCDEWGNCIESIQQRACVDIRFCKQEFQKIETQNCFALIEQPEKQCKFLWLPCWLWILIILVLISSAIYYYYKKKKEKQLKPQVKKK